MVFTLAKWGLYLSLLIGGIAVLLHLQLQRQQQQQQQHQSLLQNNDDAQNAQQQQTFCYQGIWTSDRAQDNDSDNDHDKDKDAGAQQNNCFTVSAADGRFTRVFRSDADAGTRDAGWALPGLWDGHGHLLQYGEFLHSVDLFGATSPAEVRRRLRDYVAERPGAGTRERWVRGVGWDQMVMGGMPSADMLESDEHLRGLFIMLDRVDVHCTWVSQAVLDLLPDDSLPDEVPGGEIIRDPGMGVFCDNAMDLVVPLWPRPDRAEKRAFLRSATRALHRVGLVGVHDAGVTPADVALYEELSREDGGADWSLRVYAMLECPERNTFCPEDAVKIARENDRLSVGSVKLFADGALGSWGSAMLEPYTDRPDTTGSLLVNASTLTTLARSWAAAGFQVNIHAIGDLANRLAVDALEAALADVCPDEPVADCQARRRRFRIEHAQIIHPDDQRRMRALGIVPSIQPTHATSDMRYAEARLGPERTRAEAYRMRSLWSLAPVLGSDFPVEPPNPFAGIYAAVTRRSPHTGLGPPGAERGWHAEEALSLAQALDGFTSGPARGAFLEGRAGVIAPGAFADWIVLDRPLEAMDIEDIRFVQPRETWVAGRRVYVRDDEGGEGDVL